MTGFSNQEAIAFDKYITQEPPDYEEEEDTMSKLPYVYKGLSPRDMGKQDALDDFDCVPSDYYGCPRGHAHAHLEYIVGYLSEKPEDRGALMIGAVHGLALDDEAWITDDELQAEAEYVDQCQSGQSDWRHA